MATRKARKPLQFEKGALHRQLGVPEDKKIPPGKMKAAASGAYGPKAEKRANFAKNVLVGRGGGGKKKSGGGGKGK